MGWDPKIPGFSFIENDSVEFDVSVQGTIRKRELAYMFQKSSKRYNLTDFSRIARKRDQKFAHLSIDELESKITRNDCYKHAFYATDVEVNALDPNNKILNLHSMSDLLQKNYVPKNGQVSGITSPLGYIGSFGTFFAWHVEDLNLFSISILLHGKPKIWYGIEAIDRTKFEKLQSRFPGWPCNPCSHPLRHKSNIFSPKFLAKHDIKVHRVTSIYFNYLNIKPISEMFKLLELDRS